MSTLTRESYKTEAANRSMVAMQNAIENSRKVEPRINAHAEAFFALQDAGVIDANKELWASDAQYGFTVKVTDPKMWGAIHKVVGKLICSDKNPIGDGRKKMVQVTMTPERTYLCYSVRFQFEKKLDKNDKCKVVTTREKVTRVVCNV